jgi:hypothetical protein
MNSEQTYGISYEIAAGLNNSVLEGADFSGFLRIRQEMSHFLLNLNNSSLAEGRGQQIHFLFLALQHLDNIDREIRICGVNEAVCSTERIHDRIRSLKALILNYIRHLTAEQ